MANPAIKVLRAFEGRGGVRHQKGDLVRTLHMAAARARVNAGDAVWLEPDKAPPPAPRAPTMVPEPVPEPRQPRMLPPHKPAPKTKKAKTNVSQCKATTKSGSRCKRTGKLTSSGYCPLHAKKNEE